MIPNALRKIVRGVFRFPSYLRNAFLARRVKRKKSAKGRPYRDHPKVTAILQFFNKRQNITRIMAGLRKSGIEEIIVIDDGSLDGSHTTWMRHLTGPNDFLLRSNDIYEVRTYDRAIGMARGEFICLLQDDDLLPDTDTWVREALRLFEGFPDLLILGGRNGLDVLIPDAPPKDGLAKYTTVGAIAGCPGVNKYVLYYGPSRVDPTSGLPLMFSMAVNRAPVFLRRAEFLRLGGINQRFAPFQCDDIDASIRAWLAGYKVGLYECQFRRNVGIGGMRLFQEEDWRDKQTNKAWALVYELHGSSISSGSLQERVDKANGQLSPRKNSGIMKRH